MDEGPRDRVVDAFDRDAMMRFGRPYGELTEVEQGEVCVWATKGFGTDLAAVYAARDGQVCLARLTVLFAPVDEARRQGWRGTGLVEEIAAAQALGTPDALRDLAESLERTWHDERLNTEQVVEAVERVEELRAVVRRMEACGLRRLADGLPGARPLPRDTDVEEVIADLVERLCGPLTPERRGMVRWLADTGRGVGIGQVLSPDSPDL